MNDRSRQEDVRRIQELLDSSGGGQTASDEDLDFGRLALDRNFLTAPQLSQLAQELREARTRGEVASLGKLALSHGWMQPEDLLHLGEEQARQAAAAPKLSRYEIRGSLGEGASALVYRAWDRELKRLVALKVLRVAAGMSGIARNRFKREAAAAAGLVHPNVVAVYDAAEQDGQPYLVMELIDGRTLQSLLTEGVIPKKTLLGFLEQAARGVAAAHEKGIVHRDLKPANILVTSDGDAKVADFGLAHLMDSESALTRSGAELGTPYYMSPEQVDGRSKESTPATDVYALGAILYEILTGTPPHARPSLQETFAAILSQDPAPLRSSDPRIHADLETICLKALEKDPQRRYPTAREFAHDLRAYLAGEFISAVPIPRWKQRLRRALKNRVLVAAVALILLVSVGAAAMLLRQSAASRLRLASERELAKRREAALQKLGTIQATILERDRELRQRRVPPAQARRDVEAALAEVDSIVKESPDFPQGYYVRARGRMLIGDVDGAERDLRAAVAREPGFRPGWSVLGILKVSEYQSKLEGPARNLQARIQSVGPILEEAKTCFTRGWKPGSELEESVRWGLPWTREDQVMERLARAFQLFYQDKNRDGARALLEEGDKEYQAEEYAIWSGVFSGQEEVRMERLTEAIRRAPGYIPAYHYRAMLALMAKDYRTVVSDLDQVLSMNPRAANALLNRGVAKRHLQDHEGAIQDLTRAIEIDPTIQMAFQHRGIVYAGLGKKAESLADFDRAVALSPDDPAAVDDRGIAKLRFGDKLGALLDFSRAIELNPNRPSTLRNRGAMNVERKEFAAALSDLDRSIQLDPKVPEAFGTRGLAREATGDLAGAIQDYEQALRIAPKEWRSRKDTESYLARAKASLKEK